MIISEMEEANKNLKKAKNIAIEALQTAENANKAKTDFLSNMSHDNSHTHERAIIGIISLIRHNAGDKEKVIEYADKIAVSSSASMKNAEQFLFTKEKGSLFNVKVWMKQSPHLYSILIRRKCPLYVLKISGCIIIILMLIRSCLYARREHSPKAPSFVFSNYHIGFCRSHSARCAIADVS